MTTNLVLMRHGQSLWNAANRFTGWVDVGLTERGIDEARAAGVALAALGMQPDLVFTSLLRRSIDTAYHVLDQTDRHWVPQHRNWRLNERHYGALAGMDRDAAAARFGADQIHRWRRSYAEQPPALDDTAVFANDPKYHDIAPAELPRTESLCDVESRLLPYWHATVEPTLQHGRTVLVVAHGNTLRALVKHIERLDVPAVEQLEIATGIPRCYTVSRDGARLWYTGPSAC